MVGTFGPHTPYVAPPERYEYYRDKITLPVTHLHQPNHRHPALRFASRRYDDDTVRQVRAAYYGMVEEQDHLFGQLYQSWQGYLQREGKKGIVIYISDHGEQIGEHDFYTKCTLLEGSTHIPMIMAGEGIPANQRVLTPVSLLDIAPTLLDITGASALPDGDGISLWPVIQGQALPERSVIAEMGQLPLNCPHEVPAQVIRQGSWKLLNWDSETTVTNRLINEEDDLYGTCDRSAEFPEISQLLQKALTQPEAAAQLAAQYPDIAPAAPRKLRGKYLACIEEPFFAHPLSYGRMIRRGDWKLISYSWISRR